MRRRLRNRLRNSTSSRLTWAVAASAAVVGTVYLTSDATAQANRPSGADRLRAFLEDTRTLRATFQQQLYGADGEIVEYASGELSLARPGRFYWHYLEPIEQVVVADGVSLWIYDTELEQASVTPIDETVSASPAMLLSGESALDDEFEIRESFENEELSWARLVPRASGTDFKEIEVGFDDGGLRALRLLDSLDQVTSLRFSDVELNVVLAETMFQFVPPEGADVIGEPG